MLRGLSRPEPIVRALQSDRPTILSGVAMATGMGMRMTSRDFCFWLQGFLEISAGGATPDAPMTLDQIDCIQRHLALVFTHEIDPSMGNAAHQQKLNEAHNAPGAKPAPHPFHSNDPSKTLMRC